MHNTKVTTMSFELRSASDRNEILARAYPDPGSQHYFEKLTVWLRAREGEKFLRSGFAIDFGIFEAEYFSALPEIVRITFSMLHSPERRAEVAMECIVAKD